MVNTKAIWEIYAEDIKRFIFSKVKNDVITNDLLQEVFIKVHTKISTLQKVEKLKPWLLTIARNTVLDYFRASRKELSIEQHTIEIADENVEFSHEHTEQDCLYGIIKNLPKKYRDPLFLADIKGVKQAEIAKQLNLLLPTVKSQIQRARKMIAQGFIDCCGYKLNDEGHLIGEIKNKEECKVCS